MGFRVRVYPCNANFPRLSNSRGGSVLGGKSTARGARWGRSKARISERCCFLIQYPKPLNALKALNALKGFGLAGSKQARS